MAKKSVVLRNEKRKKMASKQDVKRRELKAKAIDPKSTFEDREEARKKLQDLPRNGARVRVRNRCVFSGRSRGVYKKFMIPRIVLRELAHGGIIPGMTKSSW